MYLAERAGGGAEGGLTVAVALVSLDMSSVCRPPPACTYMYVQYAYSLATYKRTYVALRRATVW